jgi:heme a synthase
MTLKCDRSIIIWLYTVCVLIFLMVMIGGVTRLTDSGLSIVEWKPILGAIPPLNDADWLKAFDQYKQFPEYQKINKGMSLSEFKFIYFWEYFHRLFGRLIGLVFFIPYVYFLIRKKIPHHMKLKLFVAFILGGLQGAMGWYMVKSGLIDRPDVSHYRLAAHFGLALFIIAYIYWIILQQKDYVTEKFVKSALISKTLKIFLAFLILQIIYGAFVAGLKAGIGYNTFPLMGNEVIAQAAFEGGSFWHNIVENNAMVQFIHRSIAWIILILSFFLIAKKGHGLHPMQTKSLWFLFIMVMIQFTFGVLTLLSLVSLPLALTHQLGAVILLLMTMRAIFFFGPNPSRAV